MADKLLYRDRVVQSLCSAVSDSQLGLRDVPQLIEKVLREEMWRERRIHQTGEIKRFATFAKFLRASPPEGLGSDTETLLKLCAEYPNIVDLIDRALQTKRGKKDGKQNAAFDKTISDSSNFNIDNVNFEIADTTDEPVKKVSGNSQLYALRRLRNLRPDLHSKVLHGEMTAHKAMIAAGLRQRTIYIPLEPAQAGSILLKHFAKSEIKILIKCLKNK